MTKPHKKERRNKTAIALRINPELLQAAKDRADLKLILDAFKAELKDKNETTTSIQ